MSKTPDPSMSIVKARLETAGLTLQALGVAMGFPPDTARQSAHQALKVADPHISTLRRFSKALGIPVEDLVSQVTKKPRR